MPGARAAGEPIDLTKVRAALSQLDLHSLCWLCDLAREALVGKIRDEELDLLRFHRSGNAPQEGTSPFDFDDRGVVRGISRKPREQLAEETRGRLLTWNHLLDLVLAMKDVLVEIESRKSAADLVEYLKVKGGLR